MKKGKSDAIRPQGKLAFSEILIFSEAIAGRGGSIKMDGLSSSVYVLVFLGSCPGATYEKVAIGI